MPSPVRAASHGAANAALAGWPYVYCAATPHVSVLDNATVRLDRDNEPQPDALLRIDAAAGGQSTLSADDYVEGAPELVVEVAGSSAAYDMHDKRNVYRRCGVLEYIVWRVHDQAVDWQGNRIWIAVWRDDGGMVQSWRLDPGKERRHAGTFLCLSRC